MIEFVENDGGRSKYFKGQTGDCVTRAIAIVTGMDYKEVYDGLYDLAKNWPGRGRKANLIRKNASPRNGVYKAVTRKYLEQLGATWVPLMGIGSGCKVHLRADELPSGRLIIKASKHVTAVLDGVLHDTYDCSRNGTRCVYGYWRF